MQMRIKLFHMQVAALVAVLLAGLGCESAKKPSSTLPASFQGAAPIRQAREQASQARNATVTTPTTTPAPQTEAKPAEIKPDPVAELIAKAEKEYAAGENESNAGRKDTAKEHFDRALNLLAAAPLEIRDDQRLQHEYDRVLEGQLRLEPSAPSQADNASEQKSEPAPI